MSKETTLASFGAIAACVEAGIRDYSEILECLQNACNIVEFEIEKMGLKPKAEPGHELYLSQASIEDNFDRAFNLLAKYYGYDEESVNFIVLPNTDEVIRILKRGYVKYTSHGLWIVVTEEGNEVYINRKEPECILDVAAYDSEDSVMDALNKSDLLPYYGQNNTYMSIVYGLH